jgi:hypothetical protein
MAKKKKKGPCNNTNEEWRTYYGIILDWMNGEKGMSENWISGYTGGNKPVKSIEGNEEYYIFVISTSRVIHEFKHKDWVKYFTDKHGEKNTELVEWVSSTPRTCTLDDLSELNEKLKAAGAEKVYFQTHSTYYKELENRVLLTTYTRPNELLIIIK